MRDTDLKNRRLSRPVAAVLMGLFIAAILFIFYIQGDRYSHAGCKHTAACGPLAHRTPSPLRCPHHPICPEAPTFPFAQSLSVPPSALRDLTAPPCLLVCHFGLAVRRQPARPAALDVVEVRFRGVQLVRPDALRHRSGRDVYVDLCARSLTLFSLSLSLSTYARFGFLLLPASTTSLPARVVDVISAFSSSFPFDTQK